MTTDRPPPGATYRLQLGPDLTFAEAAALVPYLADLGVTHLYLSPLLQARDGSTHGYDVADPTRVSEVLGGEVGLRALAETAHQAGMGLVGDIVPNHVGVGPENPLWERLLAEGHAGAAGSVFDVDWETPLPRAAGKVILPVLGKPYGEALVDGELQVVDVEGLPRLTYHEHSFPLSESSLEALERSGGIEVVAGQPGHEESWNRLHALLEQQHYRLVHWRTGDALVNYRRFFAINELAAVRVEDEAVFGETHGTIAALVDDGVLDGLRIDHIDGLADPAGYLARLHQAVGGAWTVVEKILAPGEQLADWPAAGGTGYDFLGDVLRLQVDASARQDMTEIATALGAWPEDLDEAVRAAKVEVMEADLLTDTDRVARRLWALTQEHPGARDVDGHACRAAVVETIASLHVYRTYVGPGERAGDLDAARIRAAITTARHHCTRTVPEALWRFLDDVFDGDTNGPLRDEFVRRFQQLSGAVMAKGVEDTFLYRQHRLVALNEVGVEPEPFGEDVAAFHEANACRAATAPLAMLTTATHDTKRGDDTRLRIAALTELSGIWREAVGRWIKGNRHLVVDAPHGPAPDAATEYLLYQTLIGVWPLGEEDPALADRVVAYLVKACREGGVRTTWTDPDEDFEEALERFVRHLLADAEFRTDFAEVAAAASEIAMVTGLSQVLLRTTSPGVPDTYQGTELWRDDLVDPDNRRPVDFVRRRELLAALDDAPDVARLWSERRDGRVKLWVLSRTLRARRSHAACFGAEGAYTPLRVEGRWADHVVAFARSAPDGEVAVTIAPRLPRPLLDEGGVVGETWGDTTVDLGRHAATVRTDVLGGRDVAVVDGRVSLAEVLVDLPVALLVS